MACMLVTAMIAVLAITDTDLTGSTWLAAHAVATSGRQSTDRPTN